MSTTAIDKYWQTLRPLRKVGKTRGVIEVPAFTANCGPAEYTLELPGRISNNVPMSSATDQKAVIDFIKSAFTIAIRFKPYGPDPYGTTPLLRFANKANLNQYGLDINYVDSQIRVVINNGADFMDTTDGLHIRQWNDIFLTYDGSDITVYLNGVIQGGTVTIAAPLTTYATETLMIPTSLVGQISEYVIWDTFMTPDQVLHKRGRIVGDESDNTCKVRFPMREGSGTSITDVINGLVLTSPGIGANNWINTIPPVNYGGSFICGKFAISTDGKSYSLKWPVQKPTSDVNFIPCISWVDSDENIHRFYLWSDVDGVNLLSNARAYTGQVIPEDATLEIWNSDGSHQAVLEDTLTLMTSILNIAVDYAIVTTTASNDNTIAINTALACNFPLDFSTGEITFEVQQTYN